MRAGFLFSLEPIEVQGHHDFSLKGLAAKGIGTPIVPMGGWDKNAPTKLRA
jgi:hypothetical protein